MSDLLLASGKSTDGIASIGTTALTTSIHRTCLQVLSAKQELCALEPHILAEFSVVGARVVLRLSCSSGHPTRKQSGKQSGRQSEKRQCTQRSADQKARVERSVHDEKAELAAAKERLVLDECRSFSGFVGVFPTTSTDISDFKSRGLSVTDRRFYAECMIDGSKRRLGYFPTAKTAALQRARSLRDEMISQGILPKSAAVLGRASSLIPPIGRRKTASRMDIVGGCRPHGPSNALINVLSRPQLPSKRLHEESVDDDSMLTRPRLPQPDPDELLRQWESRFGNLVRGHTSQRRTLSSIVRAIPVEAEHPSLPVPSPALKRPRLLPLPSQGRTELWGSKAARIGECYQACLPACEPRSLTDGNSMHASSLQASPRADVLACSPDIVTAQARETAALLTAASYGPMNSWSFVAPSDCGLGLFARVSLQSGQAVGEYGGPRLPNRLHTNGEYVLQLPDANEIIDGAYENSIYNDGPRWPVVFANHSRAAPNARIEYWPTARPEPCEVRGQMWVVASEPIAVGAEIRVDYETGGATYWLHGPPPELARWIEKRVPPPPPTTEEPRFLHTMQQTASEPAEIPTERLPWDGERGGDERLEKLVPLLAANGMFGGRCNQPCRTWGLVATHLPGRTGRECFDRWLYLHAP